jgi:beta-galactosidase
MILNPLSKFVACALGALTLSSLSAESIRKIDFNTDWRFSLDQKADAYEPALDDSAWRELNLPHDWVIENSARPDQPFYQATGVIPGDSVSTPTATPRSTTISLPT